MEVFFGYKNPSANQPLAIALGNFDGVHKGHKKIIEALVKSAKENNIPPAILTFEPHPAKLFKPDLKNYRLTTLEEKKLILESLGIEQLYVIKFDANFAQITADEFIKNILIENLNSKIVFTGDDFSFGYKRGGDTSTLKNYSKDLNFEYNKITEIMDENNQRFSSSAIREFLQNGTIEKANNMLGHKFFINRVVKEGQEKGREIGFPTINFHFGQEKILPKFGVYKTITKIDDKEYKSITNIGIRPTVEGTYPTCETHIFDFNQDVYGKVAKVSLEKFIRAEQKFNSLEELKTQIKLDITIAKNE
jgi:riboflavin kinase/FMN adenylyltransferase